jgi:hypothetical protein
VVRSYASIILEGECAALYCMGPWRQYVAYFVALNMNFCRKAYKIVCRLSQLSTGKLLSRTTAFEF